MSEWALYDKCLKPSLNGKEETFPRRFNAVFLYRLSSATSRASAVALEHAWSDMKHAYKMTFDNDLALLGQNR